MADDARPARWIRPLVINRIAGASSSQNAGDQPQPGVCSGSGVSPSNTQPEASQVPAARVMASGCMVEVSEGRRCMGGSGAGLVTSLRPARLTDCDVVPRNRPRLASPFGTKGGAKRTHVRRPFPWKGVNGFMLASHLHSHIVSSMSPTSISRYAVFGHPVAHSLSPRLHALFAAQTGIALEYTAIDAAAGAFDDAVHGFFAAGGSGANVTLPHKGAAFALADTRTATAQRLGVANVLTRLPDGRIEADSNDGAGMLADMRAHCGIDPRGRKVLLLGAGGAARAAAIALLDAGVASLVIANRTLGRAQALVAALDDPARVGIARWEELARCEAFDVIVNATSAGVRHAELALPSSLASPRTAAYDLSYGEAARPFVAWAQNACCTVACDGLGMLVETAAASFERWHGVRPDGESARRALGKTLPWVARTQAPA